MATHFRIFSYALIATPLLAFACPALATPEQDQAWFQLNTSIPINGRFRVTLEQIARFSDKQDGLYQTEFGGAMNYKIARNVEFGFGYRRVDAHGSSSAAVENRLRQFATASFSGLVTRLRVDERFSAAGHEIGFRIRPLIRYNQMIGTKGLGAFVSHESFYLPNTTRWGQKSGYDRMRNAFGLTIPVLKGVSADVGYLNQYRPAHGGARGEMDHALNMAMTISLNTHPSHKPGPQTDD